MESWSVLRFSTYSPTYVLRTHAAKLSNMTLQVPQIYEYLNRGVRRNTRSTTTLLPLICEVYNIASKMLHCFVNPIIHSREKGALNYRRFSKLLHYFIFFRMIQFLTPKYRGFTRVLAKTYGY